MIDDSKAGEGDGPIEDELFKKKSNRDGEMKYIEKLETEIYSHKSNSRNVYSDLFDTGQKEDYTDFLDRFAALSEICVIQV